MRQQGIRVLEIATAFAVVGIFVSLAIPSLMRMQARSHVDHLLEAAQSCREDLPRWLSNPASHERAEPDAGGKGSGEGEIQTFDAHGILEDYARIRNERFQSSTPPGEGPLLVVEPTGTLPVYCKRDGRIHIIPFADPAVGSAGVKLVVTDEQKNGGPNRDGILAVYDVFADGSD